MAVVTSDTLLLTQAGIKTEFDDAYVIAQEEAEWNMIAEEVPTTLPIQKYAWLGRSATMQQFPAETAQQGVRQDSYTLADIIYKGEMTVERKEIEDDQYGLIMGRARDLGYEPTRHWNELAYLGLSNGFTALGYDGLSFFNSSHNEGASGNQSNTSSSALSDAALQTADAAIRSYVDDKGKPLNVIPDTLVVGPYNSRKAEDLCGSQVVVVRVGDGAAGSGATAATPFDNYFKGRYRVVVNPYLSPVFGNQYNWFLLCTKRRGKKPIVIQSRQDVPITLETDMDQPSAKITEEYNVTVRGRYVQGYGLWQLAYGSNASS